MVGQIGAVRGRGICRPCPVPGASPSKPGSVSSRGSLIQTSSTMAFDQLARALGWFSIGLGVVEFFAPRRVTETLGMEGRETLVRAFGVREILAGIMSLSVDQAELFVGGIGIPVPDSDRRSDKGRPI